MKRFVYFSYAMMYVSFAMIGISAAMTVRAFQESDVLWIFGWTLLTALWIFNTVRWMKRVKDEKIFAEFYNDINKLDK